jgi:peroxiredoxin family protein
MTTHRVVLEIEVDAETPLEAAKEIQEWLDEGDQKWQFYVQPCDMSGDVFSVDLQEDDEDAVHEIPIYIPLIKS